MPDLCRTTATVTAVQSVCTTLCLYIFVCMFVGVSLTGISICTLSAREPARERVRALAAPHTHIHTGIHVKLTVDTVAPLGRGATNPDDADDHLRLPLHRTVSDGTILSILYFLYWISAIRAIFFGKIFPLINLFNGSIRFACSRSFSWYFFGFVFREKFIRAWVASARKLWFQSATVNRLKKRIYMFFWGD